MLKPEIQERLIQEGRAFTKGYRENDPYEELFVSDQEQKLPQPPLVKAAVTNPESHIPLPRNFDPFL